MAYSDDPISVGDWLVTILVTSIPVVNIIMLLVWAFGSDTPETKANWAKASLIWLVIWSTLSLFMFIFVFSTMWAGMDF